MSKISNIVILQRLRNNIISYLDKCTEEKQLEYQKNVPIADVPSELMEQWSDEFDIDGYIQGWYTRPTYTDEELQSALVFEAIICFACENMPDEKGDINEVFKILWWPVLKEQAKTTLDVFMKRGRLSDDLEEPNR